LRVATASDRVVIVVKGVEMEITEMKHMAFHGSALVGLRVGGRFRGRFRFSKPKKFVS
jgi:hypothetical protein